MRFIILVIFCLFIQIVSTANDGTFYANGNHLIPMIETRISIKKEILQFKRINGEIAVTVYYEFFNPDAERTLDVGFEAECPQGDVPDHLPKKGQHPYIKNFEVIINDSLTPFKVSIVDSKVYYKNGIYKEVNIKKVMKTPGNEFDYRYVYHFKAKFKKGLNIIKHQYRFKASTSVIDNYSLTYVLTTAMRWANKQIDDFTLNIEIGDFQTALIEKSFFKNSNDWKFSGKGKSCDTSNYEYRNDMAAFYIENGGIRYHKINFKTQGEFYLANPNFFQLINFQTIRFDYRIHNLTFDIFPDTISALDSLSLKVLKILPFARRGCIFKNTVLQNYFESQLWYRKDPEYEADLAQLTTIEKKWLNKIHLSP